MLRSELEGTNPEPHVTIPGLLMSHSADHGKISSGSRLFLWKRLDYYSVISFLRWASEHSYLEKAGGRFQKVMSIDGMDGIGPMAPSVRVLA